MKGLLLIAGGVGVLALWGCAAAAPKPVAFEDATAGVVDFDQRVYQACRQAVHHERIAALREQTSTAPTPLKRAKKLRLEN